MNTITQINPSKVKVVKVADTRLIQLLMTPRIRQTYVTVPDCQLPETAVVTRVYPDYRSHQFVFEVFDPSFDEVPDGEEPPALDVKWTVIDLPRAEGREKP